MLTIPEKQKFLGRIRSFQGVERKHWPEMGQESVLKNFANFTVKHIFWSLFIIKMIFLIKAPKCSDYIY